MKAEMMMLLEDPKSQPNSSKEGIDSHKTFIQLNMNTIDRKIFFFIYLKRI